MLQCLISGCIHAIVPGSPCFSLGLLVRSATQILGRVKKSEYTLPLFLALFLEQIIKYHLNTSLDLLGPSIQYSNSHTQKDPHFDNIRPFQEISDCVCSVSHLSREGIWNVLVLSIGDGGSVAEIMNSFLCRK